MPGRPDFTFLMPNDLVLHMDVKFPLDNYVRYVNAETELEQTRFRDDFVKDVKGKVRELVQREYTRGSASSCQPRTKHFSVCAAPANGAATMWRRRKAFIPSTRIAARWKVSLRLSTTSAASATSSP